MPVCTSSLISPVREQPAGSPDGKRRGAVIRRDRGRAAGAPPEVLAALGIRFDPLAGQFVPPGEATIRRVLEFVDAARLDAAVTSWLASAKASPEDGLRRTAAVYGRARPYCPICASSERSVCRQATAAMRWHER